MAFTALSLAIGIGLALLSSRMVKQADRSKLKDDTPSTTATRGDFIPRCIGRRRFGPVILGIGKRIRRKEKIRGKKGKGDAETDVFYEEGWHAFAYPGPANVLWRITQNGQSIFEGPITPFSHPSGSLIDIGKEGKFRVYWGERTQPVNDGVVAQIVSLARPTGEGGISSRWPYLTYIVWEKKRLGVSPNWSQLDYEWEFVPQTTLLTQSIKRWPGRFISEGVTRNILEFVSGSPGANYILVKDNYTDSFKSLDKLAVYNNTGIGSQTFLVLYSESINIWTIIDGVLVNAPHTRIYLDATVTGTTNDGIVEAFNTDNSDGYNPAHMIAELLFEPAPYGMGHDTEEYDIESLEEFGRLMEAEEIYGSLLLADGQELDGAIAAILQDCGFMLSREVTTGKLRFMPIRDVDNTTVPTIPTDLLDDPVPDKEVDHLMTATDRLVFSFVNRDNSFKTDTIGGFSNAGQIEFLNHRRSKKVDMTIPNEFGVAARVAERRSLEELAKGSTIKYEMIREARKLVPGRQFFVEGDARRKICISVESDPYRAKVEVEALDDFMGAPVSSFVNERQGGGEATVDPLVVDTMYQLVEVPDQLLPQNTQGVIMARVRGNQETDSDDIWLSEDGISYVVEANERAFQAGGVLLEPLDKVEGILEVGPTFRDVGPDLLDLVINLSAEEAAWKRGEQMVVIEEEIFFLRNIEPVSEGVWRMRGLIPARFATLSADHATNTRFFIMGQTQMRPIESTLLAPEKTIYGKPQPLGSGRGVPLDQIGAATLDVWGRGLRPMDQVNVRVTSPHLLVPVYDSGSDVSFEWDYRSAVLPRMGAGEQDAGEAHAAGPVDGSFIVSFSFTENGSPVRTFDTEETSYTYDDATLFSDFGDAYPTSFWISVINKKAGFSSRKINLQVFRS